MKKYILDDGRSLYFSNAHNLFWIGENPEWTENFYDESMYSLRLEISHQCNGYCKYCIVYGNKVQKLEKTDIEEMWSWLQEQEWFEKITDMFLIGGEPLMCFDEIRFLRQYFHGELSLSTNGTLITPEMADFFRENNVFIYISLDGKDREMNVNRVYRDGRTMYDDIINGLEILEQHKVKKGIFMVATQENIANIEKDMEELSKEYTIVKIGYSLPHWVQGERNIISPEQYRDALLRIYKNRKNIKSRVMQIGWRIYPMIEGKIKRFSCALHTVQTTVLPEQTVVRCSKIDGDSELSKITNDEITNGCPYEIAKKSNAECRDCIALASCGGGCPYDGLRRFGTIIDHRECVITPAVLDVALADAVEGINRLNQTNRLNDGLVDVAIVEDILVNG